MPIPFKVTAVQDASEWASQYGPMLTWRLDCIRTDTNESETIELNSKPDKKYKAGDSFFAEWSGKEYKGIRRYKRVKPPDGVGAPLSLPVASAPSGSSQVAPVAQRAPQVAYEAALAIARKTMDDLGATNHAVELFGAILRGEVESPLRPKTTVTYFSNVIETAGVEQADWDVMDRLCNALTAETDKHNVRALLIATCGVQSRKDLTADKAKLFIETLKTNLQKLEEEKRANLQPDDEEIPF